MIPENEWRIDYTNSSSLHNFVDPEKLDLTCVSKEIIGLIGSSFFLGFCIGAAIIPIVSDKHGRKIPLLACIVLHLVSVFFGLFISKDIYLTMFCFVGIGLATGGLHPISTTYACEIVPANYQTKVIMVELMFDSVAIMTLVALYSISKDWVIVHLFEFVGMIFIFIMMIFVPESPKFYYLKGRYDEARNALH